MKIFKSQNVFIQDLAAIIFRVSSITFMAVFMAEYLCPGFVTNWFNPAWILLIALISVIMVATND